MMGGRRDNEAGFTLVEMLIAMFIFALISAGTMTALSTSIAGKAQLQTRLEHLGEIETARALIAADMANITLRRSRDSFGSQDYYALTGGLDHVLRFTRTGRDNPGGLEPRGDLQRITYLFEDGQLIRRILAHENPVSDTPYFDRILLSDVRAVDVEFIANNTRSFQLLVKPEAQAGAPIIDVFALKITFENEENLTQYFEVKL
ncbi:MAG: type II secretion system minor pseudopilin GspJ [Robiginitomaculum sp.]